MISKVLKYSIFSTIVAGFCVGMSFLAGACREERSQIACKGLEVTFCDSLEFVSENDIRGYLNSGYGNFVGQKLDSVGLAEIEELLESKTAILRSEAWLTDDGTLHLSISQRAPVLRFQRQDSTGFYVDDRGFIFPLHHRYTADVPVINGVIPVNAPEGYKGEAGSPDEKRWIEGMIGLNNFISGSRIWKNAISDISVRQNGDIVLITRKGPEHFIFGKAVNIGDKFDRMEKYYSYILPARGEENYKSVNIKYNRQIICRKDI